MKIWQVIVSTNKQKVAILCDKSAIFILFNHFWTTCQWASYQQHVEQIWSG